MLVQRREWDAGMDPDMAARRGFNPRDFDLGHKLRLVDGEHDVFGDGSVVCLPTHGHTPGHQSLKLRLAGGDIVLAADSCYFCRTLRERRLPRFVHDRQAMLASLPEAQRQTLEIAFFEGLTYPEIAARENVPLGTIKSRAARALAALERRANGDRTQYRGVDGGGGQG